MNPLTLANAGANVIIVIAVVDMAIRVFGNSSHRIHDHPELFYIRKFVSSLIICGSALNIATLSTPTWTEIVLNYGFAINYLFSCYYDRITSSSNSNSGSKVHKQRPARRAGGVRKASPRSTSSRNGRKRPSSR